MLDAPTLVISIQTREAWCGSTWELMFMDAGAHGWTLLLSFPLGTKEKSEICMEEGKDGGRDGNKQ